MTKTKRNVGREILDGLREIKRGEYGRVINVPDVAKIREKTGPSQSRFASLLGVSMRTLQDWEQGRRAPSGAARTLLLVADKNPRALLEAESPYCPPDPRVAGVTDFIGQLPANSSQSTLGIDRD
jgi:putative transcriptional regulator